MSAASSSARSNSSPGSTASSTPRKGVRAVVRSLSHTLIRKRGGITSDDATLFLIEWREGAADHLATLE